MKLNITRGAVMRPQRVVIYAPEGLGKSTLAASLPNPLFLDFEQGTHHLDVARLEPSNLKEVESVLDALIKDHQGFQTLVIDTVDWLEEMVTIAICEDAKKHSLEDFGYGKGYVMLAERFNALMQKLNEVAKKMSVVCLAHSHVKKFELPDGAGAFDRYELKLTRNVKPLLQEWCDALLFGNWKTKIRERDDGMATTFKGVGGKERILFCSHTATADAKNRHGLKDEEVWDTATVMKCLGAVTTAPAPAAKVDLSPPTAQEDQIPMHNGKHALDALLAADEAAANAYLVSRNVIQAGQTFRDVPDSYAQRVLKSPDGFLKQIRKGVAA